VPRSSTQYWLKRPDRISKPPGSKPKISDEKIEEIIQYSRVPEVFAQVCARKPLNY
jgi:hypothetical protein